MSKVFFISDTHFGHNNICKYRPQFSSAKEHDVGIEPIARLLHIL